MFLVLFLLHIYLPEYIELKKKKKKKTLHINLKYYKKTCTGQSEKTYVLLWPVSVIHFWSCGFPESNFWKCHLFQAKVKAVSSSLFCSHGFIMAELLLLLVAFAYKLNFFSYQLVLDVGHSGDLSVRYHC